MSDKILAKYVPKGGDTLSINAGAVEPDGIDDLGAFGLLRDPRACAVMLELRKANGNILAVGYGWLERIEFNPSECITLHFAGGPIRILGRSLNAGPHRLFQGIVRHRVEFVREADEAAALQASSNTTVVETIEW